ncbi:MAG: S-methyl-5'-thioadenosine phosphorylase [Myxococcales bacterium]|nr:S-methyl-5'-thioadenosine phosphorylase [Myxococcales bacterium]
MKDIVVGVIGGSGLGEALGTIGRGEALEVDTPFGKPSGPVVLTEVAGVRTALLARHGDGHRFNPSSVPYRANIYALKKLGVTHVLASAAVGSLREEIAPRHLVIPDQVIDRTFRRPSTFFDELAVHVEFASPFCPGLRALLVEQGRASATTVHSTGTYVCMEGPQFSTRAESELHRAWGAHLIGMTVMPEAKLAREAELCYAMVALPTDYDCWRPHPDGLDQVQLLKEIIGNLKAATEQGLDLIRRTVAVIRDRTRDCSCQTALAHAIWSDKAKVPAEVKKRLEAVAGKYWA